MGAGKKFGVGIKLVIMTACYFGAVHYNEDVQDAARIAVVSFADDGVAAETAELIWEEEQEKGQGSTLSLCFWSEQEDMQFSCKETGQTVQATGLLIEGDPELVAQESGILAWQEKGCVMDYVTAQELFGTQQANGQLVWCGEEAYTVYGTFESLERTVVLRAEPGNSAEETFGAGYDHLSLRAPKGTSVKTEAEQLLMRYGLSGDIADFTFPGVICGNLLLVLPIVLAVGLVKSLWSCLREEKRQQLRCILPDRESGYEIEKSQGVKGEKRKILGKIVCIAMMAATVAAILVALRKHLQIPADMIPTRWSDFSFWPQWWARQKANLLQILGGAQGEMQLEALWSFGLSLVCNIFAIGTGISLLNTE